MDAVTSRESIMEFLETPFLGPVLIFLLYFNDLGDCLKHSRIIQFLGDTVLYCTNKAVETIEIKSNERFRIFRCKRTDHECEQREN